MYIESRISSHMYNIKIVLFKIHNTINCNKCDKRIEENKSQRVAYLFSFLATFGKKA